MKETIRGEFNVASWDEKTVAELGPDAKITEAKVTQKFSGDLAGDGEVIWIMCYTSKTSAKFVGMQRFSGELGGRSGGFVMDTDGSFDGTLARGRWSIIGGSGTGALAGIEGEGNFEAPHGPRATWQLEVVREDRAGR